VCGQKWTGGWSKDWAMQENLGFGFWVGSVAEIIDVAIGAQATDDGGTRRGVKAQALVADGDLAIVTDADAGLQTPDERPPRTVGNGPDDGAFFCEGLVVGLAGRLAQFAVDFVLVGVRDELVEEEVGADQFDDLVGDQEWDEPFLPVIVAAFDFPFGLGCWGIEQFDPVEVEGLTELGEGVGVVGIEEGVVVHVESKGQAVGLEDAREEVEVGQQGFAGIKTCASVQACGVIQNIQQDLLV